jgi:hypothetical protein
MTYIKPFLKMLAVNHIRDEVYTKTKLAEATYHVPGASPRCVEGFRSVQNGQKGTKKMVWSSGRIKWINRYVELELQEFQ